MRLILSILLISANYQNIYCEEEPNTEVSREASEKTLSTEPEPLQSKSQNAAENKASKSSESGEDNRVSRTSVSEPQFDDSSQARGAEVALTEKSVSKEAVGDSSEDAAKEPKDKTISAEASQDFGESVKNGEKQLEEHPETRSAFETEDGKAKDLLEASAERKLSDNEQASFKVEETDRSSEITTIKENSDESGLDKNIETRRMLSRPDFVFTDTKTKAGTTFNAVEPEGKIALNQNLNINDSFNEIEPDSNIKLTENSRVFEPVPVKTTTPFVTNLATQEIFDQRFLPKSHPRPELNINYPNVNSDFQGPRDLPIYLKVKPDDQLTNQFMGMQNSQLNYLKEGPTYLRSLQQSQKSQGALNIPGALTNKQFDDSGNKKTQVPLLYQNQGPTGKSFLGDTQLTNLNQDSKNCNLQCYRNQGKISADYKLIGNLNHDSKNYVQSLVNSKNNKLGNHYPVGHQLEENLKEDLGNQPLITERYANPYTYLQRPTTKQLDTYSPTDQYIMDNINPKKILSLYQKLASASAYPVKLYSPSSAVQNYPYYINPTYQTGASIYDLNYKAGFQPSGYMI